MIEKCIDNNIYIKTKYSTTYLLTEVKPTLEQRPEYKLERKLFALPNSERKGEGGLRIKGFFKKSYENKPLISIVTVVYNGEKHLEQTINSVLEQGYDNIEYIIIDGGSIDSTLDIIKKYEAQIDYWVSEPDKGIFDAMNKGLVLASGDFISFINADYRFKKNIINKVIDNILDYPSVDFFYGDVDVVTKDQNYLYEMSGKNRGKDLGVKIPHQSCFIRLDIHRKYQFDISYKIAADRAVIAELFKHRHKNHYMNISIVNFMEGGASANSELTIKEIKRYRLQYFGLTVAIQDTLKRYLYKFGVRTKLKKILFQKKEKL